MFTKTIVLIYEHNENGSSGLILNRSLSKKVLNQVEEYFPRGINSKLLRFANSIHSGGPIVRENRKSNIFQILHNQKDVQGSIKLFDDIYWGGDFIHLLKLIDDFNNNTSNNNNNNNNCIN